MGNRFLRNHGIVSLSVIGLLASLCATSYGQHIHVLMVADTADPSIGGNCTKTVQRVREAFQYLVPKDRYSLQTLESAKQRYSRDTIVDAIRQSRVARNDTFVFLYDGHGARSGEHHFLHMPDGGRLFSQELQDVVRAKPCDLRIILTSSCNVPVRRPPIAAAPSEKWDVKTSGMAPVMQELFIRHSGLMHMNSSWPGQFSFTDPERGSWFFDELLSYCTLYPTAGPTWRHVDRLMDRQLGRRFQQVTGGLYREPGTGYTQRDLRTITWSFPAPWPDRKLRFGVTADDDGRGSGVKVMDVDNGGPGASVMLVDGGNEAPGTLRRGDVILTIFGEDVKDAEAYLELVRCSPRKMHLTFERNGKTYRAVTTLRW
ncbi:MAG: caspase family protein [Pirellulales bacterium]